MKVEAGDRVRFLNEVGGGLVTRTEGNLVFVEDEDGFEIPVPVFEVVVIEKVSDDKAPVSGSQKRPEKESRNQVVSEKEPLDAELEESGHDDFNPRIYLAFLNAGKSLDENGVLQLHLINDSNYHVTYLFSELGSDGYMHALFQGHVEPNTKLQLKEMPLKALDANWEVQLLLYKKGKPYPALAPVSTSLKLKAKRFLKDNSFTGNDFFYQPAVLISIIKNELEQKLELLTDTETQAIIREKEAKPVQKSSIKRASTPELLEVDLHIHELLDNWNNLSNSDIIQIQLDKFNNVMDANLKNRGRRIVFIHGVGNGTLKTELRKQLDRKYKGFDYQDASFREYGYGATMVMIK
jgi:hypothetical protein